jgi:hypothetical protein
VTAESSVTKYRTYFILKLGLCNPIGAIVRTMKSRGMRHIKHITLWGKWDMQGHLYGVRSIILGLFDLGLEEGVDWTELVQDKVQ